MQDRDRYMMPYWMYSHSGPYGYTAYQSAVLNGAPHLSEVHHRHIMPSHTFMPVSLNSEQLQWNSDSEGKRKRWSFGCIVTATVVAGSTDSRSSLLGGARLCERPAIHGTDRPRHVTSPAVPRRITPAGARVTRRRAGASRAGAGFSLYSRIRSYREEDHRCIEIMTAAGMTGPQQVQRP